MYVVLAGMLSAIGTVAVVEVSVKPVEGAVAEPMRLAGPVFDKT